MSILKNFPPIKDYLPKQEIWDGRHCSIVSAEHYQTRQTVVIKFANKTPTSKDSVQHADLYASRALIKMTGAYGEIHVPAGHLLPLQYRRWLNCKAESCARIIEIIEKPEFSAVVLERVNGFTLRELMKRGHAGIEHLRSVVQALCVLEQQQPELRHGDLKPENLLLSVDGKKAVLIDPGYYGIVTYEGNSGEIKMTTPEYYPLLIANDMFALGIIILELCTGSHPLKCTGPEDTSRLSKQLLDEILYFESQYNYFASALRMLPNFLASNERSIAPEMIRLSMGCLGLDLDRSGKLDISEQFNSFKELSDKIPN